MFGIIRTLLGQNAHDWRAKQKRKRDEALQRALLDLQTSEPRTVLNSISGYATDYHPQTYHVMSQCYEKMGDADKHAMYLLMSGMWESSETPLLHDWVRINGQNGRRQLRSRFPKPFLMRTAVAHYPPQLKNFIRNHISGSLKANVSDRLPDVNR